LQEFFAKTKALYLFSYTRLLIVIGFILLGVLFWKFRKAISEFNKATQYINTVITILIVVELFIILTGKNISNNSAINERVASPLCDTCKKPSVYLVVMDEYLGSDGLREYFGYDNSGFESFLKSKGFKVLENTRSNYQLTLFSMTSLLNMSYIDEFRESKLQEHFTYKQILYALKYNSVCRLFRQEGYTIRNYSNFEIENAPGMNSISELPQRIDLITSQTLIHQIKKYYPFWLQDLGIIIFRKNRRVAAGEINEEIMGKTIADINKKSKTPTFAYVHLMMPHVPYLYDSTGRLTSDDPRTPSSFEESDDAYLQYLVYTNRRVSKFVTDLQTATKSEAAILLMSDHGLRKPSQANPGVPYKTFNAVFMPGRTNDQWKNGMSNVNQFRVLFNTLYGTSLPLLRDSIVRN
jgi:Sulfatase